MKLIIVCLICHAAKSIWIALSVRVSWSVRTPKVRRSVAHSLNISLLILNHSQTIPSYLATNDRSSWNRSYSCHLILSFFLLSSHVHSFFWPCTLWKGWDTRISTLWRFSKNNNQSVCKNSFFSRIFISYFL